MILESIKMSWENIIHNKLRSFLTMLGVVIGVASIIALITLLQGATNSISDQVKALGVNKITVNAMGTPLKQGLSEDDIGTIGQLDNITGISPTVQSQAGIVYNGKIKENVSILGKNEVYFNTDTNLLRTGRVINPIDVQSTNTVAVIGSNIEKEFFYGKNPVGQKLTINGITYTIIGVLSPANELGIGASNDNIVVPYTTALRNLNVKSITSLDVYLHDTDLADETVINIKAVLNKAFNYKDNAYTVFNMGDMIQSFQTIMSMMSLLLSGIAGISLVVGGIGIMNMMLVSITERTKEIGLRKALGATPGRIQLQFIMESIFLSVIGGAIGLVLGAVIAYVGTNIMDVSYSLAPSTIALALGFSAGVGVIFGYMPARKASRLNPIDALRSL
ncbi:putative ABC transport system permease protein [Paenibacillus turicensis]|uniref:ABC transport system permease protein n=1 Tax=Paenibacillus turicensis TaxID=160487 RepID=A0ABS4FYU5_9BACL|nr:ABC transporter permease [Paenibacillus turicensis]MBP1907732.1 putative ABC transport system permease protein [Paenibacillus turicensis]